MAHNLNFNNGKWSFAYVGEKAWHGLGTAVESVMTASEAVMLSQMNFLVNLVPAFVYWQNEYQRVPDRYHTIRTDNGEILGSVGKGYEVVQNTDLFSFFDPFVERGEAMFHTAGVLGKGETVWLLAKLPDFIKVGDEKIEKYILLTGSHDGTSPVQLAFTPVRVVCNNTLNIALKGAVQKFTAKHTKNVIGKMNQGANALGIVNTLSSDIEMMFNQMTDIKVSPETQAEYLLEVFPDSATRNTRTENIRSTVAELVLSGAGSNLPEANGTLWGLYNSVTEYADHVRTAKNSPDDRANSIWFGTSANIKLKAFDIAKSYVDRLS